MYQNEYGVGNEDDGRCCEVKRWGNIQHKELSLKRNVGVSPRNSPLVTRHVCALLFALHIA